MDFFALNAQEVYKVFRWLLFLQRSVACPVSG